MTTSQERRERRPATRGAKYTGEAVDRVEDRAILTGEAEYIHDATPDGCLHMTLVRSMHAHATVEAVDASAAREHPDCKLVLTGADIQEEYHPMPCHLAEFSEWPLAVGTARFAGEPIALVVATDRYVAEDAAELIDVSYDRLDPVVDPMEARTDDTVIHEEFGSNVGYTEQFEFGDVDGAFEEADHVVTGEYSWGRISGVPLETAGVVAEYDPDVDRFDIYSNLQLHTLTNDVVSQVLGYDSGAVRLRDPAEIGGTFGTKITMHRYCCLAAIASHRLGTPVKFVEDRVENLQGGDAHSSERDYDVRIALDDDGTIRGVDVWFVDDFGAFPRSTITQALKPVSVLTGAYDVPAAAYEYEVVLTNKTSQAPYRGYGVPPHNYALEMAIDDAAREIGMDPDELRRRNLIAPGQMPYTLPSKNVYDSGDYPAAFERMRETIHERERREGGLLDPTVVAERREDGKFRGVRPTLVVEPGVASTSWQDRFTTDESEIASRTLEDVQELPEHLRAEVRADGTVRASIATDSAGQGHRTLLAQLLADELDLPMGRIQVDYLDSVESPTEFGSAASRLGVMLAGAASGVGQQLIDAVERRAAAVWDVDRAAVTYRSGAVERRDGTERLSLAEVAAAEVPDGDHSPVASYNFDNPIRGVPEFEEALERKLPAFLTTAYAVNSPIIEVDVRTGEIEVLKFYSLRDCGTMLNPTIVEGQAHGGIAQGLGAALMEEFVYDQGTGQPLATTLFEYLLPSVDNVPEIHVEHTETPSPFTPRGAKGTGEGGMIDAPASIAASINAALDPFDVTVSKLPFTPDRLRRELREKGERD